jgi:hypothetical protein
MAKRTVSRRPALIAAIEDQRIDQIFLIGKVAGKHGDQTGVLVGIGIGRKALPVGSLLQGTQKSVLRVGVAGERFVDEMVVGIENVETVIQPFLGRRENREVVLVLDIVMTVKLTEEELQPWREELSELGCGRPALATIGDAAAQMAAQLAKHVMALQPHRGHGPDVGVAQPRLARIFFNEITQVPRQTGASLKSQCFHVGLLW